jgi:hypothetical protein
MSRFFDRASVRQTGQGRNTCRKPRPRRAFLSLEQMEDRLVPAVFNVNSLADILTPPSGVVTMRSAIQAANQTPGGNTINLTLPGTYKITLAGTPGETDNAAGEFAILPTGNLTIQNTSGGTVVVDGNHMNRVFDINPNFDPANPTAKFTVTLQGFTIQNGVVTDAANPDGPNASGGGIRDMGNASLTLANTVVTGNTASADGGGVSMENVVGVPWTLTVNNSVISNNHAGDAGGGLEEDGTGKVFINAGTVISGNTCVNQGAGIWLDAVGQGPVVSVTIANGNGGTGYTSAPTVTFSAPPAGGVTATGTAVITNGVVTAVTITNPGSGYTTPPTITFTDGGGTGTTATANLLLVTANLTVTGAVISDNTAITGIGGGIGNAGTGTVTITGSTISHNYSGATGGGFGDQNAVGTLIVQNSLFLGNSAVGGGGGINVGGPTTTITSSEIKGNSSAANGGGIFANGVTLTVLNSTVADNTAAANGGGFEIETSGTGAITNTTITGNSALNANPGDIGGGVDVGNGGAFTGTLTLLNDTINANFAFSGGGLAMASGGVVNVQNTIIAQNQVTNAGPDYVNSNNTQFTSLGGNLIGINNGDGAFAQGTDQNGTAATPLDPKLGPLQNNGGPTVGVAGPTAVLQSLVLETEALLPGSPAIAKGSATGAPANDERGFAFTTAVDIGAFQTGATPNTTPNQRYVNALYQMLLQRPADPGAAFWVNLLNQGASPATVVMAIEASTEYRTIEVQAIYQHFLHRAADPVGLQVWVSALGTGVTIEQLDAAFIASPEYFQLHGGTTAGFLAGLYQDVLSRTADASGLSAFTQLLNGGFSRSQATSFFLTSQEYLSEVVAADYQADLGRAVDSAGSAGFVLALESGMTDQAVAAALLGSGEAFARLT